MDNGRPQLCGAILVSTSSTPIISLDRALLSFFSFPTIRLNAHNMHSVCMCFYQPFNRSKKGLSNLSFHRICHKEQVSNIDLRRGVGKGVVIRLNIK